MGGKTPSRIQLYMTEKRVELEREAKVSSAKLPKVRDRLANQKPSKEEYETALKRLKAE